MTNTSYDKNTGFRLLIISIALLVMATSVNVKSAFSASLKSDTTITSDKIKLGDVFDDVPNPDIVIGNAPEPGSSITINASTLNRIANRHKLAWAARSTTDQLTLKRDASLIDAAMITDALHSTLIAKGLDGNFTIALSKIDASIVLPSNFEPTVEVGTINYIHGRDTFTATLAAPSAANPVKTLILTGVITRNVQVPVLRTSTRKGDVISASDITWIEMPLRSITKDTLVDADDIIGHTPTSIIASDRPIRMKDIALPQMVSRGEDVTIIYELGGMALTAKGKSQQNGAKGDLIRVVNLSSTKSMSAEVMGDRLVKVQ